LPDKPGRLAPEDEALLNAEKETVARIAAAAVGKRKTPLQVPWLRKSEFITAIFDENLYNKEKKKKCCWVFLN
jgi:cobalamin biosynthesis protein CbiG